MLYLNSPPEAQNHWEQLNPNIDEYHVDPMAISTTFWLPNLTNWWLQQDETQSKKADHFNVPWDVCAIIPHGVGVQASCSLGRHVIAYCGLNPTGETLCGNVIIRKFDRANNRIFEGDNPVSYTTNKANNSEMKNEAEDV